MEAGKTRFWNGRRSHVVLCVSWQLLGWRIPSGAWDRTQAVIVSEKKGVWGQAQLVPGMAKLNTHFNAEVDSISCTTAGNCAAGGSYSDNGGSDGSYGNEAFVVDEKNGVWQSAVEVPGTAELNVDDEASVSAVSCTSVGNCTVGGGYLDSVGYWQSFGVDETSGTWGQAEEVPGTAALSSSGVSQLNDLSCASPGNCVAGGYIAKCEGSCYDGSVEQAYVVSETGGVWGQAEEVPGLESLNVSGGVTINAVSCASVGACSVGGSYYDADDNVQAFVSSETKGVWRRAEQVPKIATLEDGAGSEVLALSCGAPGDCSAGGDYSSYLAFVVNETNGTWKQAREVPGTAKLNSDYDAQVNSISCVSGGNCVAGGFYTTGHDTGKQQAFVAG
jgi:hypothetical protein